ncbi:uncharacterized protein LOC141674394 [Apium graveolens]|uniref:uncharacterized protein LOC141674394 n=1 Tax=Apium graveolens TaxID=4045 RepID=UPI003D78DBFD
MSIILRFVDRLGILRECFFEIVYVSNTTALKEKISTVLSRYNLHISNMRGQGYDGASNMSAIVNLIDFSPKWHTELHSAQVIKIARMVTSGERDTGRGINQIGNLHRSGATRWSSHFDYICSLIDMYGATISVLESVVEEGTSSSLRGEAGGCLIIVKSFDFIFTLHMMHKIMGITDLFCRTLQHKSLDIVSPMNLVSTTKSPLVTLREEGFDHLLVYVQLICTQHGIEVPDMNALYKSATGRSCQQNDSMTIFQHYHFDIFNSTIDFQQEELHSRFSDGAVELLTLTSALDPKDNFRSFKDEDIYKLAENLYPGDFSEQELHYLRSHEHYKLDVIHHTSFQNMTTINELCRRLVETNKVHHYNLIDRLIRLVLTLPVSTATAERSFSAIKLIKTALHNKMEEEFLTDSMMINIERELVEDIETDFIIHKFYFIKNRRYRAPDPYVLMLVWSMYSMLIC